MWRSIVGWQCLSNEETESKFILAKEYADKIGREETKIIEMIREGKLIGTKKDNKWFVNLDKPKDIGIISPSLTKGEETGEKTWIKHLGWIGAVVGGIIAYINFSRGSGIENVLVAAHKTGLGAAGGYIIGLVIGGANKHSRKRYLIANGVDVNAKNKNGNTALMRASWYGYKETVESLIANGADINAKNKNGWTALRIAKSEDKTEIVKLLEKAGAK